jgi:hypothetical protein
MGRQDTYDLWLAGHDSHIHYTVDELSVTCLHYCGAANSASVAVK